MQYAPTYLYLQYIVRTYTHSSKTLAHVRTRNNARWLLYAEVRGPKRERRQSACVKRASSIRACALQMPLASNCLRVRAAAAALAPHHQHTLRLCVPELEHQVSYILVQTHTQYILYYMRCCCCCNADVHNVYICCLSVTCANGLAKFSLVSSNTECYTMQEKMFLFCLKKRRSDFLVCFNSSRDIAR